MFGEISARQEMPIQDEEIKESAVSPLAGKSLNTSLRAAEDEGMNIMRALVRVDRLQVHHVANHVVLIGNAVRAMHIAGYARNFESFPAVISFEQRNHLGSSTALVLEAPQTQTGVQAQGNLGLHIRELFLDQLVCSERAPELKALHRVLACGVPAEFRRADGAPRNAVAGIIQAAKRPLQT